MEEHRAAVNRVVGLDPGRGTQQQSGTSPTAPSGLAPAPPRAANSAHIRRNSDGALEDELARVALSDDLGTYDGHGHTFAPNYYGGERRDPLGMNTTFVPPQFNGSFLVDDDDLSGSVPVSLGRLGGSAPSNEDGLFERPPMGRRDSIGALDLAPLAQTRRGSRGNLRSELASWDALRMQMHGGMPQFDSMMHGQPSQAAYYAPRHHPMQMPPMHPMQQQQPQPMPPMGAPSPHSMYGGPGMPPRMHSPLDPYGRQPAFRDSEYRAPLMGGMHYGGGIHSPGMSHSPSTSSFSEDWQDNGPHHRRGGIPKSVSVPTSLTDVLTDADGQHMPRGWDDRMYAQQRPQQQQFGCRYCKNPSCTRGERCRYNSSSPGPSNAYGGPLRHSTSGSLEAGHDERPSSSNSNNGGGSRGDKGRQPSKSPGGSMSKGSSHKRNPSEGTRFPPLEQLKGQIYPLCRDQHGCRHLQKKLEEGEQAHIDLIFNEIYDHILELMSDPFGNYLCQKLFTHCNDEQKLTITRKAAPGLVAVSLNMHGTRSVQKLIDCLNTDEQVQVVVEALRDSVVPLIKDLNGNHVIQKCLNRLRAEQNQFIYDAVSQNCVAVASHRHGCCVLQRCIDHANDAQKIQLAAEITYNALTLVQDAFGNYVVQYILDLKLPRFSDALIRRFLGHVYELSLQKFSSNVIEKCIRVAEPDTRRGLIAGLLDRERLPHLLQDSFANYVVQTSLDVSEPEQYAQLVEIIRPILPSIRHLPYCKRIQSKLQRDMPQQPNGTNGGNGAMPMMPSPQQQQQQQQQAGAMYGMPPHMVPQQYAPQYARTYMGHVPPPSQQHAMYFMQTAPTGTSE